VCKNASDESAKDAASARMCRLSKNELIRQKYATHFDPTPTAYGLWPGSGFCRLLCWHHRLNGADFLSTHLVVERIRLFIAYKLRPSVMLELWPHCECARCNFSTARRQFTTVPWTRPLCSNL